MVGHSGGVVCVGCYCSHRMCVRLTFTCDAVVISTMILGALPCAVALFPQLGSIPAASVEQEFRNLTADDGTKVTTFWYNKGL